MSGPMMNCYAKGEKSPKTYYATKSSWPKNVGIRIGLRTVIKQDQGKIGGPFPLRLLVNPW